MWRWPPKKGRLLLCESGYTGYLGNAAIDNPGRLCEMMSTRYERGGQRIDFDSQIFLGRA